MRYPKPPFTPRELFETGRLPLPRFTEPQKIYLFTEEIGDWRTLALTIFHPSKKDPKREWEKWIRLVPFRAGGFSWIGWSPPEWKRLTFSPFFLRMKSEELLLAGWQPDLLVVVTNQKLIEIPSLDGVRELHAMLSGLKAYSEEAFLSNFVLPFIA